jgi:hypothetical protein
MISFGEEGLEVERIGNHGEFAGRGAGPFGLGAVAVEFDAILIGVAEVEGFAHAVIRGPVELDAGLDEAAKGIGEGGAVRVKDRGVIEPGGAGRGRASATAFPGVEADVVMVAAGGDEGGLGAEALLEFEPEHAAVKGEGAVKVGDLEVNVTDADGGMEGHGGR